MRVISKARLQAFWRLPGHQDAEGPLRAWHTHVNNKTVSWHAWGDVKAEFGSASLVGNCIVFNIGGNKYRLITRIIYRNQKVFVLKVMPHKEYDQGIWKEQCGCLAAAPERTKETKGTAPQRRRKGR